MDHFTVEEIYLIKAFDYSSDKTVIIQELTEYMKYVDPDMAEIAQNAADKLRKSSDKEFCDLINYPAI